MIVRLGILMFVLAGLSLAQAGPSYAQGSGAAENGDAPQILTSDLYRKQIIKQEKRPVSFVFVDADKVVEVEIDGNKQQFTPDNSVVINTEVQAKTQEYFLSVVATDEKGNSREKIFLLVRQEPPIGANPFTPADFPEQPGPAAMTRVTVPTASLLPVPLPSVPLSFAAMTDFAFPEISAWPFWTGGSSLVLGSVYYLLAFKDAKEAQDKASTARSNDDAQLWVESEEQMDKAKEELTIATALSAMGIGFLIYHYLQDDGADLAMSPGSGRFPKPPVMVSLDEKQVAVEVALSW